MTYVAYVNGEASEDLQAETPFEFPYDLSDPAARWGQRTSYEPSVPCDCQPYHRVGYIVDSRSAQAPFQQLDEADPIAVRTLAISDSLATIPGFRNPVGQTFAAWQADLDGDAIAFFALNRTYRRGLCLAVAGWTGPGEGVHGLQANAHDCAWTGASRYRPWTVLRGGEAPVVVLASTTRYSGSTEPTQLELWRLDADEGWVSMAIER